MQLKIQNLSKTYANGVQALKNISLEIPTGMFGLLGPNGAGKSTLMRTIATLQEADSGQIFLGQIDVGQQKQATRKMLGYLPQEFNVYPKVSALDLLNHLAILKGMTNKSERKDRINTLLERVNLSDFRKKAVSSFSGGMKQRFGIAQALLGNPKLIIVDEPTAGLDPGERNRFYNLLSEIGEQVIVILSTHIVQDIQQLCSKMAIINQGELIYSGTPKAAIDELHGTIWEKVISKSEMPYYEENFKVISSRLISGNPLIHVISPTPPDKGFQRVEADLEDVFFTKIMGVEKLFSVLS